MSGAAADWRRFLSGRYAAFGTLAVSDAIAVALAGDGLAIPLVATLGASPALATLIGLLPFLGGVLQALVPAVLRRNRGDLRGLTIVIASIGLMRPLLYLAVVASEQDAARHDRLAMHWGGVTPRFAPASVQKYSSFVSSRKRISRGLDSGSPLIVRWPFTSDTVSPPTATMRWRRSRRRTRCSRAGFSRIHPR